ncbi:GNAT family N-acetyltransferase [bacterium]|nr:MAG: GNAT family N-acetyltransferase [bacterium]
MTSADVPAVVALQPLSFPPPFNPDYHWDAYHIERHLAIFPEGQFVAEDDGRVIASSSNTRIPAKRWPPTGSWSEVAGGPGMEGFDPNGEMLYGMDISVHPDYRGKGVGRAIYEARYDLIRRLGMAAYGTTIRLPDFSKSGYTSPETYANDVAAGKIVDRTMTPLLKMGLTYLGVVENHMYDPESNDAAGILEWRP